MTAEQEELKYYEYIVNTLFPDYFNSQTNKSFTLYYIDNNILYPYLKSLNESIKQDFDYVDRITYSVFNNGFSIQVTLKYQTLNSTETGFGHPLGRYIANYLGLPYDGYYTSFGKLIYPLLSNNKKYTKLYDKILYDLKSKIENLSVPKAADKNIFDRAKIRVIKYLA